VTSGQTRTATSGASGTYQYTKILVPAGATQLKVTLTGPSCGALGLMCNPDLDLYVGNGSKPTTSSNSGSSASTGNSESVTVANPAANYWYIGVYVYSGSKSASYTVTATVS